MGCAKNALAHQHHRRLARVRKYKNKQTKVRVPNLQRMISIIQPPLGHACYLVQGAGLLLGTRWLCQNLHCVTSISSSFHLAGLLLGVGCGPGLVYDERQVFLIS